MASCTVMRITPYMEGPSPKRNHTLFSHGCELVCYGGYDSAVVAGTFYPSDYYTYVFEDRKWQAAEPHKKIPNINSFASFVKDDSLYVIGGRLSYPFPRQVFGDVWRMDLASFNWTDQPVLGDRLPPRHSHSVVLDQTCAYLFGGTDGNTVFSDLWRLEMLGDGTHTWRKLEVESPASNIARYGHGMLIYEKKLYIFGGAGERGTNYHMNRVLTYDIHKNRWTNNRCQTTSSAVPEPRRYFSLTPYQNFAFLIGGMGGKFGTSVIEDQRVLEKDTVYDDIWRFDMSGLVWSRVNWSLPAPLHSHAAAVDDQNDLYIFGGETITYLTNVCSNVLQIFHLRDAIFWN